MKRFGGSDKICDISSLDPATLYISGEATVVDLLEPFPPLLIMLLLLMKLVYEALELLTVGKNNTGTTMGNMWQIKDRVSF